MKLFWEESHSPAILHSICYVTKPNSTTVHFSGSLSWQHCPLVTSIRKLPVVIVHLASRQDLSSHDDPSCLVVNL